MFKRVERNRKRRKEEEELGLDDSDESDSDPGSDDDKEQSEEDPTPDSEDGNEEPPISMEEALKDPIYLVSLDPTIHACVLCKGKLMKNAGMVTAHKHANVHMRRFEHFRLLSADADPHNNARELVNAIQFESTAGMSSKRALKRQAKQAALRERRKRHKELRTKAISKKAMKKMSAAEEARPVASSKVNLQRSTESPNQPVKIRKKRKLESSTPASKTHNVIVKSTSRGEASK